MSNDNEIEAIRQKKIADMVNKNIVPLPENVVNIESVDHFNQVVNDYQDSLIIVDFCAEWCGPCKSFGPHFEALQKENFAAGSNIIFSKLNVDHHQSIAQQFQVSGIPTTLFIKGKKLVHRCLPDRFQPGLRPRQRPVRRRRVAAGCERIRRRGRSR